jgi:hypothetical protein
MKQSLGRLRRRWEVNIKIDLTEVCWSGKGWIHLAQYTDKWTAPVIMAMHILVPKNIPNGVTYFLSAATYL